MTSELARAASRRSRRCRQASCRRRSGSGSRPGPAARARPWRRATIRSTFTRLVVGRDHHPDARAPWARERSGPAARALSHSGFAGHPAGRRGIMGAGTADGRRSCHGTSCALVTLARRARTSCARAAASSATTVAGARSRLPDLAVLALIAGIVVGSGGGPSAIPGRGPRTPATSARSRRSGARVRGRSRPGAADENAAITRTLAYTPFVRIAGDQHRELALTFDDGPGPVHAAVLLGAAADAHAGDVLRGRGARAVLPRLDHRDRVDGGPDRRSHAAARADVRALAPAISVRRSSRTRVDRPVRRAVPAAVPPAVRDVERRRRWRCCASTGC